MSLALMRNFGIELDLELDIYQQKTQNAAIWLIMIMSKVFGNKVDLRFEIGLQHVAFVLSLSSANGNAGTHITLQFFNLK